MKSKSIDTGFGIRLKKIKVRSSVSDDVYLNDYEIKNLLKKKMKGGKKY